MADLHVRLNGEDNLSKTIDGVKQSLDGVTKESTKLEEIQRKFTKIQNSTAPLKKRLAEVKKLMAEMNMDGLNKTGLFTEMAQEAGSYADAMGDATQAVNAFANDTMNLQASADAMQLVASSAAITTGVMGLLGVENDKVQAAMLKVQSAIALVNGVQQISNLLNKDSVLMLKVKQIMLTAQTAATAKNTVAEGANTVATGANTIARQAWNVVTAVGKALLGDFSGLVLVGAAALATYAICTSESTDTTKKNTKAVAEQKSEYELLHDAVGNAIGQLVNKYLDLQMGWKQLQTTAQKTQFLKDNASAFDSLGVSIDGVSDAEDFLVNNTGRFVEAVNKRAEAMAKFERLKEAWTQKLSNMDKLGGESVTKELVTGNQALTQAQVDWLNNLEGANVFGVFNNAHKNERGQVVVNGRGAAEFNKLWMERQHSQRYDINAHNEYIRSGNNIQKYSADLQNTDLGTKPKEPTKPKGSGAGNKKDKPKTPEEQRRELYDTLTKGISTAKSDIANGLFDIETIRKRLEQVNNNLVANGFDPIDVDMVIKEASFDKLKNKYNTIKTLYDDGLIDKETFDKEVDDINAQLRSIGAKPIKVPTELELKREALKKLSSSFTEVQDDYDNGLIDVETAKRRVDEINAEITKLGGKPVKLDIKTDLDIKRDKYNEIKNKFSQLTDDFTNKLIDKNALDNGIEELNKELQSIGLEPLKIVVESDGSIKTAQEDLTELQGVLEGLSGGVGTTVEEFMTLAKVFGNEQATAADMLGASLSTLGGSLQALGADGAVAKIGAVLAAVGQIVLGFATASAQAASLGPFGWLAFVGAGLGAAAAAIGTIKGFADGGIVQGSTFHGDGILARVNAGEMILNKNQQSNLYNALKNGNNNGGGGQVEFVIKGSTLQGALNNYNSKQSRIR